MKEVITILVIIFLTTLSMAFVVCGLFLFLKMPVDESGLEFLERVRMIDEYGYAGDFDKIPGIQDEKIFSPDLVIENDLFFCRMGTAGTDEYTFIIGKFTSETTSTLINTPEAVGCPVPTISYDHYISIDSESWGLTHVPPDIMNNLKLVRDKHGDYRTERSDHLVWFVTSRGRYEIKICLFGESGDFIIRIHPTAYNTPLCRQKDLVKAEILS